MADVSLGSVRELLLPDKHAFKPEASGIRAVKEQFVVYVDDSGVGHPHRQPRYVDFLLASIYMQCTMRGQYRGNFRGN